MDKQETNIKLLEQKNKILKAQLKAVEETLDDWMGNVGRASLGSQVVVTTFVSVLRGNINKAALDAVNTMVDCDTMS